MHFTSNPAPRRRIQGALENAEYDLNVGAKSIEEILEFALTEALGPDAIWSPTKPIPERRLIERAVKDGFNRLLKIRRAEQRKWAQTTDCDRFDAATASLAKEGILLRSFFSCCPTCVHAEIEDELQTERRAGNEPRAIFYFFPQDVPHTCFSEGGTIRLSGQLFSAGADGAAIVSCVRETFAKNGLNPGEPPEIRLRIQWQRRIPT